MKKWRVVAAVMAIIIAAGYWFLTVPATAIPNGSESIALYQPGPYTVVSEGFTAADNSRPTQAYDDYAGSPERVLNGDIWRPEGLRQPGPLVIYSHGFMSFRQEGLYLAKFLASHGYSVVAVDYPLTGFHAPGKSLMRDVIKQPGDVSFLIDTMLKRNADPADALHDTLDPRRIAVAGVSLGGLTTTLVTFHRALRDPRIAAAISIAGPSVMFTPDFFRTSDVPYLLIYGSDDAIVSYDENATPLLAKRPGSILVTLKGASHAGFAQPASTLMRFISNPDGIGCRTVRDELGNDLAEQNREFMAALGGPEVGVSLDKEIDFCTSPPIPLAMKASRQHMFATLAAYSFLQSVFADSAEVRDSARNYLLKTLPRENSGEVSVSL